MQPPKKQAAIFGSVSWKRKTPRRSRRFVARIEEKMSALTGSEPVVEAWFQCGWKGHRRGIHAETVSEAVEAAMDYRAQTAPQEPPEPAHAE